MEQVEQGRGIEQLAPIVDSIFPWVSVPQMWTFVLHITMFPKPRPEPTAVVQVVHKKLWLRTGTSFLHSLKFSFGRKH